jgi:hypothetical protein
MRAERAERGGPGLRRVSQGVHNNAVGRRRISGQSRLDGDRRADGGADRAWNRTIRWTLAWGSLARGTLVIGGRKNDLDRLGARALVADWHRDALLASLYGGRSDSSKLRNPSRTGHRARVLHERERVQQDGETGDQR